MFGHFAPDVGRRAMSQRGELASRMVEGEGIDAGFLLGTRIEPRCFGVDDPHHVVVGPQGNFRLGVLPNGCGVIVG